MIYYAVILEEGTRKEDRGPIVLVSTSEKRLDDYLLTREKITNKGFRILRRGRTRFNFIKIDTRD